MKVSNIRFGFATNSSSVHSIIHEKGLIDDYDSSEEFGWSEFTLASKEAKSKYLAQLLFSSLESQIGKELAQQVVKGLFGFLCNEDGYIDHQSLMNLPISPKTNKVSIEFFKELTNYYQKPGIAIVGGNDNTSDEDIFRYPQKDRKDFILPTDSGDTLLCKKDGDWWCLLNAINGTKIRLTFKDNAKPYIKSSTPELVDFKITNMCLNNCRYCYQDSTEWGKHATMANIDRILWSLQDMKVFEIALGGGEPTLHPYFHEILCSIHSKGIIANFTTRNLNWVHNDLIVEAVGKYVSRFGISINSSQDAEDAFNNIPKKLHDKIYFHYVLNTGYLESILKPDVLKSRPLIILGFKEVGRGKDYTNFTNRKEDNWSSLIKNSFSSIGIDTKLANDYKNKLGGINQELISYDEGKFSCYIDAVEMKMGNCSYANSYTSIEIFKSEDYLKEFKKY